MAEIYTHTVAAHPFIALAVLLGVVGLVKHGGEWLRRIFEGG